MLSLHRFICITFVSLAIWATVYENSLANMDEIGEESVSPSRQAIHPLHITKTLKSMNGQRIYPYENAPIDLESTEPAINKLDKLHANNIINGCTFELHPISIEHTNGNHLANNNRTMTVAPTVATVTAADAHGGFYRLNNNNANNIINNNHHASNNDDMNENNHLKAHHRNGSTAYGRKALNTHTSNHLSKCFVNEYYSGRVT